MKVAPQLLALPDRVAGYGDSSEYGQQRIEAGQWVFWEDRVSQVLDGRYDEIIPLHVELSPTYLCNFSCPWCSCRTARETWVGDDVFNHPKASPETVMMEDRLHSVLGHLAEHRVGIQWVGGEPTIYPALYRAAAIGHDLGLQQCLFTNGAALSDRRSGALLDAEFAFVRVSLNAVTPEVHMKHHDYAPERGYAERVIENLESFARRKVASGSSTELGVSIVVDERNLDDLIPTATYLVALCERVGDRAVDFVIVRPTYQFYDAQVALRDDTVSRLAELVESGSELESMLGNAGIRTVVPRDSFRRPDEPVPVSSGDACLAHGMFGEVTPRGDYVVCSDRYGNPDYFIGNVADSSIDELWASARRKEVLAFVEDSQCFKRSCPRNGRGFFFNKLFHEIERFRSEGRIDEVETWIRDLQRQLPRPRHPFFI